MKKRQTLRTGFTLLEVLLVLAILGVIGAMVVPQLLSRHQTAQVDAARLSIKGVEAALKLYALDHDGQFPEGEQDALEQLLAPVDSKGNEMPSYFEEEDVQDPWAEMFYYRYPSSNHSSSSKPDIWSSGPNRRNEDGGGDDVNNWEKD